MPEAAVFRRFGVLNAQNLLYLQAELVSMEERLRKLQAKDNPRPESSLKYTMNWFRLCNSENQGEGIDEGYGLVKEIRAKLREYSMFLHHFESNIRCHLLIMKHYADDAIVRQMRFVAIESPNSGGLQRIQRYIASTEMGPPALTDGDTYLWGSEECDPDKGCCDLISLTSRHNKDFFFSWRTDNVSEKMIKLNQKHKYKGQGKPEGFADTEMSRWTSTVMCALASALTVFALLNSVQPLEAQLGLIFALIFFFGIWPLYCSCQPKAQMSMLCRPSSQLCNWSLHLYRQMIRGTQLSEQLTVYPIAWEAK